MPKGIYQRHHEPVGPRFWAKVDKSGGPDVCWLWTASTDDFGYGQLMIAPGHRPEHAHRISYALANGPIPEGMFVLHRCDNPACVNPAHLFLGTSQDNVRDMMEKGRHMAQTRPETILHGTQVGTSKLTEPDILAIREAAAVGLAQREIARQYGISQATAWAIINRRAWRHI